MAGMDPYHVCCATPSFPGPHCLSRDLNERSFLISHLEASLGKTGAGRQLSFTASPDLLHSALGRGAHHEDNRGGLSGF